MTEFDPPAAVLLQIADDIDTCQAFYSQRSRRIVDEAYRAEKLVVDEIHAKWKDDVVHGFPIPVVMDARFAKSLRWLAAQYSNGPALTYMVYDDDHETVLASGLALSEAEAFKRDLDISRYGAGLHLASVIRMEDGTA